jgi:hypothetical protein
VTIRLSPKEFRDRFALATFSDGGIVVDLETGSYSRLNASGAAVLEELARAQEIDAAVAAIAGRFRISLSEAANHLSNMAIALEAEGVRQEPPGDVLYQATADGEYLVSHGAKPVLVVADQGRMIKLMTPPADLPFRVSDYLKTIAPKLLFLRGITVLHGASCLREGGLLGFCGMSGAGKTTTARAFAKHGSPLISEDLLIFDRDLATPSVFAEGEARLRKWSRDAADTLAGGHGPMNTDDLLTVTSGAVLPLRSVWFLDAARRMEGLQPRRLKRSETLARVMTNHFLGAKESASWRVYLTAGHRIASAVTGYELDLPNGLEHLEDAIASYTRSSTS